jgi:hypothetical protein
MPRLQIGASVAKVTLAPLNPNYKSGAARLGRAGINTKSRHKRAGSLLIHNTYQLNLVRLIRHYYGINYVDHTIALVHIFDGYGRGSPFFIRQDQFLSFHHSR